MRSEGDEVGQIADRRKLGLAKKLNRHFAAEFREIELDTLNKSRQIRDGKNNFIVQPADKNQYPAVARIEKLGAAATKGAGTFAQQDEPFGPP